tara:strand:+ start:58 stop:219 length:162 start_codon:yes stop_codon:yes gene_type:complete
MKIGDLVRLVYKFGKPRIGIVKSLSQANIGLIKVFWSSGDQTWCLQEQLEVLK